MSHSQRISFTDEASNRQHCNDPPYRKAGSLIIIIVLVNSTVQVDPVHTGSIELGTTTPPFWQADNYPQQYNADTRNVPSEWKKNCHQDNQKHLATCPLHSITPFTRCTKGTNHYRSYVWWIMIETSSATELQTFRWFGMSRWFSLHSKAWNRKWPCDSIRRHRFNGDAMFFQQIFPEHPRVANKFNGFSKNTPDSPVTLETTWNRVPASLIGKMLFKIVFLLARKKMERKYRKY